MQDETRPLTSPVADGPAPVEILPVEERKSTRFMLAGLKKGMPASSMQTLMTEKGVSEQDIAESTAYVSGKLQEKVTENGWDMEETFQMAGFNEIPALEVTQPDGQEVGLPPVQLNFEEKLEAQQDERDLAQAKNFLSVPKADRIRSGVIDPSTFDLNMLYGLLEHKNELLSPVLLAKSLAGNEVAEAQVEAYKEDTAQKISAGFNRYGLESELSTDGEVLVRMPETGDWEVANSGIIDQLAPVMLTNGLAVGASVGAGMAAFRSTPGPLPLKAAVSIGASAVAAGGGRALDAFKNNLLLKDEIDYKHLSLQMVNEAYYDALFGVAGGVIAKAGAAGLRGIKLAVNKVRTGNLAGAKEVLAKTLKTDEAGTDAIAKVLYESEIAPRQAGNNEDIAEALLLAKTQPEGASILKAAMERGDNAGFQLAKETTERAVQFKDAASKELPDSLNATLIQNLKDNETRNIADYGLVIGRAAKAIPEDKYGHNFFQLVGYDLNKFINSRGVNDEKRIKVESALKNAEERGGRGKRNNFRNLIELRRLFNDVDSEGVSAMFRVKNNIDTEIEKVTTKFMGKGAEAWQKEFKVVNTEWSKLKELELNSIISRIKSDPTNEKVVDFLYNKAGVTQASGATVKQFMAALPPQARKVVEMSVLNKVVDDFTVGAKGGTQAVYLPEAFERIKNFEFFSKEAQAFKSTLGRFADVFRSDADIARTTGSLALQTNQTFLTPDPSSRVLMMATNAYFGYVKRFGGSDAAKGEALANKVGKLLNEPLKHNSVQDVMRSMAKADQPAMLDAIKEMQKDFVSKGQRDIFPRVSSVSKNSDPGKRTDGPLGPGRYFDATAKGSASRTRQYDPNTFADLDLIKYILDDNNPTKETIKANRAMLDREIKARNLIGFMWEGSFILP